MERVEVFENALISTQINDGFIIQRTFTEEETYMYLYNLTKHFMELNASKKMDFLTVQNYVTFTSAASKSKNLTLSNVFAMQLIQFPGMTADRASAILRHYSTPMSLMQAYKGKTSRKEREDMLKNIEFGVTQRKLGPAISKTVFSFYSNIMK